jgi:hypothetical protein
VAKFTRESLSGIKQHVRALWTYDHGRVGPPAPRTKRRQLLGLFREGRHDVIVESGTYLGGTVEAFLDHAARIVSIELDPALAEQAAGRFAGQPHVQIVHGDSTVELPRALRGIAEPPLVWLDGHFSGGVTALGDESEPAATILDLLAREGLPHGTTVVVDDLRLFGADPAWPSLETLLGSARAAFPQARIHAEVDALVIGA